MWSFDNAGIAVGQFFHQNNKKKSAVNRGIGWFLLVIDYAFNYLFTLELWMIFVLALTLW